MSIEQRAKELFATGKYTVKQALEIAETEETYKKVGGDDALLKFFEGLGRQ